MPYEPTTKLNFRNLSSHSVIFASPWIAATPPPPCTSRLPPHSLVLGVEGQKSSSTNTLFPPPDPAGFYVSYSTKKTTKQTQKWEGWQKSWGSGFKEALSHVSLWSKISMYGSLYKNSRMNIEKKNLLFSGWAKQTGSMESENTSKQKQTLKGNL